MTQFLSITLALLVLRVLANDSDDAAATDDFALGADSLDGRTGLHDGFSTWTFELC